MNLAIVLVFVASVIRFAREAAPGPSVFGFVIEGIVLLLALIAIAWAFGIHP